MGLCETEIGTRRFCKRTGIWQHHKLGRGESEWVLQFLCIDEEKMGLGHSRFGNKTKLPLALVSFHCHHLINRLFKLIHSRFSRAGLMYMVLGQSGGSYSPSRWILHQDNGPFWSQYNPAIEPFLAFQLWIIVCN